ncbi:Ig-like domain-containing protein, partial [Pirellulales bacterium]|nr:Ig-like domain-containing protein [Pirellulales bacterium]
SLNSLPNSTFVLEFFANTTEDPSGFGEGERFLGDAQITTDASGDAYFDVALAAAAAVGEFVTATATDPNGNTSEFAANELITNAPPQAQDDVVEGDEDVAFTLDVLADNGNGPDSDPDGNLNPTLTVNLSDPTAGILTNHNDGTFTYDPDDEFETLAVGQSASVTFEYQIEDDGGLTDLAEVTIAISGVNDAPILDASGDPVLGAVNEDVADAANGGTLVSDLIGSAISDVDSGSLQGIAVTTLGDLNGEWQYSTDGASNWSNFGSVSDTAAVLLAASGLTRVRFQPNADWNGTASIAYRAWDRTSGASGDAGVDVTNNGGSSAYSTSTESASVLVAPVNDAPTFDPLADPPTILQDSGPQAVAGFASGMSAGPADEAGQVLAVNIVQTGGTLTFVSGPAIDAATGDLNYEVVAGAHGTATFDVTLVDDGGTANGGIDLSNVDGFTINVNEVIPNVAPVIDDVQNSSPDCDGVTHGDAVQLHVDFTDADVDDIHSAVIEWGDGTQTQLGVNDLQIDQVNNSIDVAHVYVAGGIYAVTVIVTDNEGNSSGAAETTATIAGIGLHDGVLFVIGSADREKIAVKTASGDPSTLKAIIKNKDSNETDTELVASGGVTSIHLLGCGAGDMLTVANTILIPATLDGGAGDDLIFGGSGNDTLIGAQGNDKLLGRGGDDVLLGGDGADTIWGNHGNDVVDAGDGDDRVSGGAGADILQGGAGHDILWGRRDEDLIYGGDGNDVLFGGLGDDQLFGDDGNDWLHGGAGDDLIYGGAGDDIILGGTGDDMLFGEDGDDVLFGAAGDDTIEGGNGDDLLFGGPGNDDLNGGDGLDLLFDGWGWIWD